MNEKELIPIVDQSDSLVFNIRIEQGVVPQFEKSLQVCNSFEAFTNVNKIVEPISTYLESAVGCGGARDTMDTMMNSSCAMRGHVCYNHVSCRPTP